jgi:DNA-binding HxlR family transcriptional regulator
MKRTSFADMRCPLARALDSFSDGWNGLVLREAFYGSARFDEFKQALGIPTNTLTRVLKGMVDDGLLERRAYSDKPPRFEYLLTDAGRDLRPVLLTLLAWGNKHRMPPDAKVRLTDTTTGKPVDLGLVDLTTGKTIGADHKVIRRAKNERTPHVYAFPESSDRTVGNTP